MSEKRSEEQTALVRALLRLRLPLAALTGLLFAVGRVLETLAVSRLALDSTPMLRTLDALLWGILASGAVWALLNWAIAQELRYRDSEVRMLRELRRSNETLALLHEISQRVASSATLDEILDYAIGLPRRLVGASAAALTLIDDEGAPRMARRIGIDDESLARARATFGIGERPSRLDQPYVPGASGPEARPFPRCVVIPLVESGAATAPLGWIEAYLPSEGQAPEAILKAEAALGLEPDTNKLLVTVAGELAEALRGARRRARELQSVVALEQAITAERARIAHDLHDGVAQSLAFMRMRIDLWEDWIEEDPAHLRSEFTDMKANLRTQIEELRRAIFALRPVELSKLGFEGALQRTVTDFAGEHGWELDMSLNVPQALPHALELAAFRVVQEALNNIAKHARAQRVSVALRLIDRGLQILVRDDGVGFNPGAVVESNGSGLGLRQMRERARALDGQVTILSRPGSGAELRVWLPLT